MSGVVGLVLSGAGGVEDAPAELIEPLIQRGHRVAVTMTPTAERWLTEVDLIERIERVTGLPARSEPRLPSESSPHPGSDVLVLAPATANTVAKLALGVADNQALTLLCESIGSVPLVVFPRINAAHARHPAWAGHLAALRSVGVDLVYGDDVWPLYEPRQAPPDRPLPWQSIIEAAERALG